MENIICANCGASLKDKTEFCDSCGEWQGISPTIEKNDNGNSDRKRITTLSNDQLNSPISTFQSPPVPTRTQFPGIRAVFFILILIPIVAGAAFLYNRESVNNTIIEQSQTSLTSSTTTTISTNDIILLQNLRKFISNCSSSSQYGEGYSCSNLYDNQESSWQDYSQKCKDGYLVFTWNSPVEIEFFTWQNLTESRDFNRNWKVRDLKYSTPDPNYYYTHELSNISESQWVEIVDVTTDTFTIEFISSYPGEEYNGAPAFPECAIQEIEIWGNPNENKIFGDPNENTEE